MPTTIRLAEQPVKRGLVSFRRRAYNPPEMTLGDSFTWAFKDPQWPGKMLVQGLIALIPIIGWMAMLGWLMMAIDNLRAGKTELPRAGFHLERGAAPFFVQVIYGLALSIPGDVFIILAVIIVAANSHSSAAGGAGGALFVLAYLLYFAAALLLRFLYPALFLNTNRHGFAGGMDFQKVWRLSTFNVGSAVIAALLIWVASIIGGLGVTLCIIPAIFTVPWENAITAGVVIWFEKESGPAS